MRYRDRREWRRRPRGGARRRAADPSVVEQPEAEETLPRPRVWRVRAMRLLPLLIAVASVGSMFGAVMGSNAWLGVLGAAGIALAAWMAFSQHAGRMPREFQGIQDFDLNPGIGERIALFFRPQAFTEALNFVLDSATETVTYPMRDARREVGDDSMRYPEVESIFRLQAYAALGAFAVPASIGYYYWNQGNLLAVLLLTPCALGLGVWFFFKSKPLLSAVRFRMRYLTRLHGEPVSATNVEFQRKTREVYARIWADLTAEFEKRRLESGEDEVSEAQKLFRNRISALGAGQVMRPAWDPAVFRRLEPRKNTRIALGISADRRMKKKSNPIWLIVLPLGLFILGLVLISGAAG